MNMLAPLFLLLALWCPPTLQCAAKTPPQTSLKASRRIQLPEDLIQEEQDREKEQDRLERVGEERIWTLEERARALGAWGDEGEEEEEEEVGWERMREREGKQSQDLGRGREAVVACYSLIRPGWQLYDSVVREKLNRFDLSSCAGECKGRVYCRSFGFSESEFLGENCHLSELAQGGEQGLQIERDAQRDDMWGIYTVAEVCEEGISTTTSPPSSLPPSPRLPLQAGAPPLPVTGCECNGFIDHQGGGECRTADARNRFWCYTSSSTCPEAPKDPFLPFMARTTQACSRGACSCNPYSFHQSGSLGLCQGDVFDSSTFCYVTLESRCPDKQVSKFFPSFHWSLAACQDRAASGDQLQQLQEPPGPLVEQHGLWNFTASYTECRDYCDLAERCKSMYTHYDNERRLCHLSTRPFYVASYSHSHAPTAPAHRHLVQDEDVERLWK